jgi:hypothetical protein
MFPLAYRASWKNTRYYAAMKDAWPLSQCFHAHLSIVENKSAPSSVIDVRQGVAGSAFY